MYVSFLKFKGTLYMCIWWLQQIVVHQFIFVFKIVSFKVKHMSHSCFRERKIYDHPQSNFIARRVSEIETVTKTQDLYKYYKWFSVSDRAKRWDAKLFDNHYYFNKHIYLYVLTYKHTKSSMIISIISNWFFMSCKFFFGGNHLPY